MYQATSNRPLGSRLPPPLKVAESGAIVPFTTRSLYRSRVRSDERHDMVLLVNAFAGEGHYVIPWRSVPDTVRLTVHDEALHGEIHRRRALTPAALSSCALNVAALGFAGPEATVTARQTLEVFERQVQEAHLLLLLAILREGGVPLDTLMADAHTAGDRRQRAKALIEQCAFGVGRDLDSFYAESERIARAVAPVGFPGTPSGPGRLRLLIPRLHAFADGTAHWARSDKSELAALAPVAGQMGQCVEQAMTGIVGSFDRFSGDLSALVREWPRRAGVAAGYCLRLSWVADGWEQLLTLWEQAQPKGNEELRRLLPRLLLMVPTISADEAHNFQLAPPSMARAIRTLATLVPDL